VPRHSRRGLPSTTPRPDVQPAIPLPRRSFLAQWSGLLLRRVKRRTRTLANWWSEDRPSASRRPRAPAIEADRLADIGENAAIGPQDHRAMVDPFGIRGPPAQNEGAPAAIALSPVRSRGPPVPVRVEFSNNHGTPSSSHRS